MKIYKAKIIEEIEAFYGDLLFQMADYPSIAQHLTAIANRMWEAWQVRHPAILKEISNYHPNHLGRKNEALANMNLSLDDCYFTIAKEYGYANWEAVEKMTEAYNLDFETAVNNLLAGNLTSLQLQIKQQPNLLNQRSQYGHRATLLHYTASNGIEFWRQKLPYNLPEILRYLIQQGADTSAKMYVYGGAFNTLELLLSSAHPEKAGLTQELSQLLA